MKVAYRKRFLKDLASVPANLRPSIERFVFEELPQADSLQSTGRIEKLADYGVDTFRLTEEDLRKEARLG